MLHDKIDTARRAIAPMEAKLAEAYDDFQLAVGGTRRQALNLEEEDCPWSTAESDFKSS